MNLTTIKTGAIRIGKMTVLQARKHSPEILAATGTVSIIAGTILACKETLKVEGILDEHNEKMAMIQEVMENETIDEETYSLEDAKKDKTILMVQTGVKLVRNYAPGALLIASGIACMLGSYGIMQKRNAALTAAYNGVYEAFRSYRDRVKEDLGEDKDREYLTGMKKEKISEVGEDGKKTKSEKFVAKEGIQYSPYAKVFDKGNKYFSPAAGQNMNFLTFSQNVANDMLRINGHLFLNEVYDMLGFPRTSIGAVVGWVYGEGDSFVDFGMYDIKKEKVVDFINGYEDAIILDFNVDGVIYDKI